MAQISTSEKIKLNLARFKKANQTFEINVDPDLAIRFKKGESIDLREVLKAEQIFSDAKKGEVASESDLNNAFHTTDTIKIAEIIIKEGEIQLTAEYREQKREQKKKQIVNLIHTNAIDPTTKLPHPVQRIELAFEEAKVRIDEYKSAEEQLETILEQLRPIIPISFEQANLTLQFPPTYAAKAYSLVQQNSKIIQETWNQDGSWTVKVELPAGLKPDFIDKLNSFTHGEIVIEEE
ncbi:ribosome assembly factor SBDS [Candidatus Woesearchaeota archaeon]|nr:ribosome assembly factor SBDS [Candidatus Woesearchaeota archaeon]